MGLARRGSLGAAAFPDAVRVLLGHGYAYGEGSDAWGGPGGAHVDDIALYLLWRAGAAAGGVDRLGARGGPAAAAYGSANASRSSSSRATLVARVAVTAPPSMHAITWGAKNCKAQVKSDVLAALRARADGFLDAEAAARLPPRLPPGDTKKDGFILVVERKPVRRRRLAGLVDQRQRHVHNMRDVLAAVAKHFPRLAVKAVHFDGAIPFALQVALWRRATVVLGIHGGALANSLFLSPGQGLVEITPQQHSCGHPSMFAHVTVAVGARYRGVLCSTCTMRDGGAVDVAAVVRAVRAVLDDAPEPAHYAPKAASEADPALPAPAGEPSSR